MLTIILVYFTLYLKHSYTCYLLSSANTRDDALHSLSAENAPFGGKLEQYSEAEKLLSYWLINYLHLPSASYAPGTMMCFVFSHMDYLMQSSQLLCEVLLSPSVL